tara:strand:- start:11564 stop:12598 length:1035 start_codon:yes stop_codon:yes gene_type:complete
MANRLIRSPQYITQTSSSSSVKSAKLELSVANSIVYTIIKDATQNVPVLFEWAELARDYLDITYTGGTPSTQAVFDVDLALKFYPEVNGGGTQIGSTYTEDHNGFDGYGTFYEAANPSMSATEFPAISNYSQAGTSSSGTKTYTMYAPKNIALDIPSINAGQVIYNATSINATVKTINSIDVNIKRIDCTKFTRFNSGYTETPTDIGYRVCFINKYGAIQTEFFTLKAIQSIRAKKNTFNSNIISSTGTYSINAHTRQNFDITAEQSVTLNSFYVPEYYNNVFTEMLLSEKVWVVFRVPSTGTFTTVPVNIRTSNFDYKNSLNERLIQFSFSFNMSFDYINNVR